MTAHETIIDRREDSITTHFWFELSFAASCALSFGLSFAIVFGLLAGPWATPAEAQSTSPGRLAASHKKWDNRCEKCHEPGKGATDNRCLSCHKKAKTSRYHWKVAQDSHKACAKCHRDHQGRGFRMIRWRVPANFNHKKTGWQLEGRHSKLKCAKCHKKAQRWMGLSKGCVNCHTNVHKPTLGPNCAKCHSQKRFAPAPRFSHDRARFRLRGRHRALQCAKCHTANRRRKRGGGLGSTVQFRGLSFASCVSCHADPLPDHSRGAACETCHTERSWRRTRGAAGQRMHKRLKFKLTHKHRQIACQACHKARNKAVANRAEGIGAARARLEAFEGLRGRCVSCHKDAHNGKFGTRCETCHTPASWRTKRNIRGFDHSRTGFVLRGRHRAVQCVRCHKRSRSYKKQYKQIPHDHCADCHRDVHAGTFKTVKAGVKRADVQDCATCHSEADFKPARFDVAAHAKARMALKGAHRVVACQDCHQPKAAPKTRAFGEIQARSPSRVAQLVGTPQLCTDCHKDEHAGQFNDRSPPLTCTTCHNDRAFRPAPGFDHNKTKFPLTGPHAKADCASCHSRPGAGAPVRFAGLTTTCASCHNDRHGGQFLSDGPKRTCEDCHKVVKNFDIPAFPHDKTRFVLEGKHLAVACARCHTKVELNHAMTSGNGPGAVAEVVHYRLGAMACDRCHSNPHQRQNGKSGANAGSRAGTHGGTWACSLCHTPTGWQKIPQRVNFNHDRTGVPLTGAHAHAACVGCHKGRRSQAVGDHAGAKTAHRQGDRVPRACLACHKDTHRGEQGSRCEACHTSRTWKSPRVFKQHASGRFPLSGVHAMVACASCHRGQARDEFRGTPTTCDACHRTTALRVASFDHRQLRMGCNQCHSTFAWAPTHFDHGVFWPLQGAHAGVATQCSKCHTSSNYAAANRACVTCHLSKVNEGKTHPDHRTLGLTRTCERCHTAASWAALKPGWHDPAFPITSGKHRRYRTNCASCHPAGVGKGSFDCVHCHDGTHNKARTDSQHRSQGGYIWDNAACRNCHPRGKN